MYENRKEQLKFLSEGGFEIDLRDKAWNEVFSELKMIMEEIGK